MIRAIADALLTALLGCGTLVVFAVVLILLAMTRIVDYNFLLDLLAYSLIFAACWGVGSFVQERFAARKARDA